MRIKRLGTAALLVLLVACSEEGRFTRTPLERWERRSFPNIGISMELPAALGEHDATMFENTVYVVMNRVHPPFGVLDDDQPLIKIDVERIAPAVLAERRDSWHVSLAYQRASSAEKKRIDNLESFQPTTVRFGEPHGYVYFRRDIQCADGHVVSARAEWLAGRYPSGHDYRAVDESTIRRILDSIQVAK